MVIDDFFAKVPALSDEVVAALVDETHRAGLRVIAHVSVVKAASIVKRLVELGLDEFVHPRSNTDFDPDTPSPAVRELVLKFIPPVFIATPTELLVPKLA